MPGQASNFFTAGWIQNDRIQKYPLNLIFCIPFSLIIALFLLMLSVQKALFRHVLWL